MSKYTATTQHAIDYPLQDEEIQLVNLLRRAVDQPLENRETFLRTHSSDDSIAAEALQCLEEMDALGDFLERPAMMAWTEARDTNTSSPGLRWGAISL